MLQARQRFQRGLDQPVAFFAFHMRQQGEAATVPEVAHRIMQFGVISRQNSSV